MTTEVVKIQKQIGLRVTSVERGGAAQKAGLEVGDIIAGFDKTPITDARQLETMAAKGKKFTLIVVDVNSGRGAQVEIDPRAAAVVAETDEKAQAIAAVKAAPAETEVVPVKLLLPESFQAPASALVTERM